MNNYTAIDDGSQKYDRPVRLVNPYWRYRNNDMTHIEPIVPECSKRRFELRVLACGRKRSDWFCEKFNKQTTVKECFECPVPEKTKIAESPQTPTPDGPTNLKQSQ